MDEITLNDDINYLELGKQDLLGAIKNQLIELKGEIYNTRIEQQKEYILYWFL